MIRQRAGSLIAYLRDFASQLRGADRKRFAGIVDFSYQHYALGDTLTTQVNLACLAIEHGCTGIDLYVVIDPAAPAAPAQGFITPENYSSPPGQPVPGALVLSDAPLDPADQGSDDGRDGAGLARRQPGTGAKRASTERDYVLTTRTAWGTPRTYRVFHEFLFPELRRPTAMDEQALLALLDRLDSY